MRLVHIADAHLDTAFRARTSELRARLREASREAFQAAVTLAIDEVCDAFLIAGDLLDGDRLSFTTERFLVEQAARLGEAGIQVVYATGNHDPGGSAAGRIAWPGNVTVVSEKGPRRIPIVARDGTAVGFITAAGHATDRITEDLSASFPGPAGALPEVAMLHTHVRTSRSSDPHRPYAPSELPRLQASGYHYWALGHVHVRQSLSDDPPIWYPGNLQGRTPMETGPRGALLVDLSDPKAPVIDFHPCGPVRWERIRISGLEEAHALETLLATVEGEWARGERLLPDAEQILFVEMEGGCPLWKELSDPLNRAAAEEALTSRLGILHVELDPRRLGPVMDLAALAARPDVLGAALQLLEAVRSDRTRLPLEVEALAGFAPEGSESLDDYWKRLTDGLDADLVERVLLPDEASG